MAGLKLDQKYLEKLGIGFETSLETNRFLFIVRSTLELRVGDEILRGKGEDVYIAWDYCETVEEQRELIKMCCPDYKEKVLKVWEDLKEELVKYRGEIPGNILT